MMDAPLPVITTHLADRRDRAYLAWVAVAGEVAHLPLDMAPIDGSTHALEICVDGVDGPLLVLLADPVGEPTHEGFPLRLRPLDEAQADELQRELFGGSPPAPDTDRQPKVAERDASEATLKSRQAPSLRPPPDEDDVAERTWKTPSPFVNFSQIPGPGDAANEITIQALAPVRLSRAPSEPPPMSDGHRAALARATGSHHPVQGPATVSRRAPGALVGRSLGDGRFTLEALLGAGASGEVYRAMHAALRRKVAVKVLHPSLQNHPDYCTRFYAEALAASRLDHPNVLRVLDYGQEPDGLLYIVMELLEGVSLQDVLDTEGPLAIDRIVHVIAQACAGLAHAHDSGVIHRDIKPENIVVVRRRDDEGQESEQVKVCDFGIAHWTPPAKSADDESTPVNLPLASQIVGTPAYMAPEQIRNTGVDARTDVYALGAVLYELATGRPPFDSMDAHEVLIAQVHQTPIAPSTLIPSIPADYEALVLSALAKDPAARPRDARVLRGLLRRLGGPDSRLSTSLQRVSVRGVPSPELFVSNHETALLTLSEADERERLDALPVVAEAMRRAIKGVDVPVVRYIWKWLQSRASDSQLSDAEREATEVALRVLRDPEMVEVLARHAFAQGGPPGDELVELLRAGGPVAGLALIDTRRGLPPSLELRGRAVTLLRALGPTALPPLLARLGMLAQSSSRQDEALAEDLLRAIPDVRSDEGGEITVRFVRLERVSLAIAALHATTALWGPRARPLLVGALDSQVDSLRLAAIEAMKSLGGFDASGIDRLVRIATGQKVASQELQLAAAEALAFPTEDARPKAIAFLEQRLAPAQGLVGSLLKLVAKDDATLLAALARSFATLDEIRARGVIGRLCATRADMRPHLEALLVRL